MTERRHQIKIEDVEEQRNILFAKIIEQYGEKGFGISVSRHEIYGLLGEELKELVDALQSNNMDDFYFELLDLAVACLHGMVSIRTGKMDW